jgi:hypothetical protein
VTMDRVFNLLGALVTVALVTTIVGHRNTARVVSAGGRALNGLFLSAQGIAPRGMKRR